MVEQREQEQEQEQEQEPVRKLPQAPGWALFPRWVIGQVRRCRFLPGVAVRRVLTPKARPAWWPVAGAAAAAVAVAVELVAQGV